jgi:DNA-binding transcriptional MerR regulator
VNDLVELERLADAEKDVPRRRQLLAIHDRLADRAHGAKVSEAGAVLGVSVPTVRAWAEAGILVEVKGSSPARVTYDSLAATRRAIDEVRSTDAKQPLIDAVARQLRDRSVLSDEKFGEAVEDLHAGRTHVITEHGLDTLVPGSRRRPRSASR